MKKPSKKTEHWLIGGAAVIGIGGLLLVAGRGAGSSNASRSGPSGRMQKQPHQQYAPNPGNAAIAQSWIAAKAQLGSGAQAAQTQDYQTRAAQAIAFRQFSSQTKQVSLQTAAEQAIAQAETAAQIQVAQTQSSAAQNIAQSQQPQWWQYLLGSLGSIGSLFGFSSPFGAPTGFGSATVPGGSDPFAVNSPFDYFTPPPSPDMSFPGQIVLPDGTVI